MCCNGTLFNYVALVPDDLPKLTRYPQLTLFERDGEDTFDEPCVLHTGKGCSAYDDRPAACSRYVCGVLRAVAEEELTEIEAVLLIKEGKALVENIKELVVFEPDFPLAVSTWEEPPEGLTVEARTAWERTKYHLGKHFLLTVNEEVEVRSDAVPPSGAMQRHPEPDGSERPSRRAVSPRRGAPQ